MEEMRPPSACCDEKEVKKGPWTSEEDLVLASYVQQHGPGNWRSVPPNTGLLRCSKSCRLRWTNYLRPGIKRGNFTSHEERMIVHLQTLLGNKWASIASYLPQRTDNDIKNYWNTHLKMKLYKFKSAYSNMGPLMDLIDSTTSSSSSTRTAPQQQLVPRKYHTSVYAWSTDNISRLLEDWTKSPSEQKAPLINALEQDQQINKISSSSSTCNILGTDDHQHIIREEESNNCNDSNNNVISKEEVESLLLYGGTDWDIYDHTCCI